MKGMQKVNIATSQLFKGFWVGIIFAAAVMFGLKFDQYYTKEEIFKGLPIIEDLTDAYNEGIAAISEMSNIDSRHLLFTTRKKTTSVENWDREHILQKLKERGFSKGKLKAAKRYLDYIETHQYIAMQEMEDSEVFASIKLAQALLESGAGQSKLAKATHNHFGIKARANKIGRQKMRDKQFDRLTDYDFTPSKPAIGVFRMTDDHHYDRFEKYRNTRDSYWRHTQLLTRDCTLGKVGCYGWIWETFPVSESNYDITPFANAFYSFSHLSPDYFFDGQIKLPYFAAAATGLKMAGYATSKTYHKKLSYIIATYELWRFDLMVKHLL